MNTIYEMNAPRIEMLPEKKLVGMRKTMSIANNKTMELWQMFMPRRREIANVIGTDFYAVQVFNSNFNFHQFDIHADFEKWASIEVSHVDSVPEGMESLVLEAGLYAVFIHQGPASEGERTFRYIFETWIPKSEYFIDNRPHFEILGAKYKNNDPESEEEVWIPIKSKT